MAIDCSISNGVAKITMDDGKVNALSEERLLQLSEALQRAKDSDAIAIIKGRPGIFSAGFDMKSFALGVEASRDMVAAGIGAILDILEHPQPVITYCTGHAFPMGAFLMLAADVRLGLEGDFQIGMNETAIKIDVPDFALALANARLSRPACVGIPVARMFSPQGAKLAGYLDYVGDEESMDIMLEQQTEALNLLDLQAFRSTKARQNSGVIKAINDAGLPARLSA